MNDVVAGADNTGEHPLNPAAATLLLLAATGTIFFFYIVAILSTAFVGLLLLMLAFLTLLALRFGAARFVRNLATGPTRVFSILCRSFWLPNGDVYRITLRRDDAPRLFAMLGNLAAQSGVAAPQDVAIEMNANSSVELRGFRRATAATRLSVGYEMLTALTEQEVHAVFAHEMAHAKLVNRGLSRWLQKGLARLGRSSHALAMYAAAARSSGTTSELADTLAPVFNALAMRSARLVATYSRQDEFEADAIAAQLCGAAPLRSALIRLETLADDVGRLPWAERLARLQAGESFSQWLMSEITRPSRMQSSEVPVHAVDEYSTHPSLRDRLSALPPDVVSADTTRPGIELLADPDHVAGRLVTEIQRVLGEQERRDSRALAKATRKLSTPRIWRPAQKFGALLTGGGALLLLSASADGFPNGSTLAGASLLIAGLVVFRTGRYRDRTMLPVPRYGTLTDRRPARTAEAFDEAETTIEAELQKRIGALDGKKTMLALLIAECNAALGSADYLRGHVAARLALQVEPTSVEAALGLMVAAASLGIGEQASRMFEFVKEVAGLRTLNTRWGAAWAMSMLDDWNAEGLLAELCKAKPNEATFSGLLALTQMNRNKLQGALANARRATALEPDNPNLSFLLAHALLNVGQVREATERLRSLADKADAEPHTFYLMVRACLTQRDVPGAKEWAARLRTASPDPLWLIGLGQGFEWARASDQAAEYYRAALEAGFRPEAFLGLSRIDVMCGDRTAARHNLLEALHFEGAIVTKGQTPSSLFHEIVARLCALEERREKCTAWIAGIPVSAQVLLSGQSVVVFAKTRAAAEEYLATILTAMESKKPTAKISAFGWHEAPKDEQPVRPVFPGVQFVKS